MAKHFIEFFMMNFVTQCYLLDSSECHITTSLSQTSVVMSHNSCASFSHILVVIMYVYFSTLCVRPFLHLLQLDLNALILLSLCLRNKKNYACDPCSRIIRKHIFKHYLSCACVQNTCTSTIHAESHASVVYACFCFAALYE